MNKQFFRNFSFVFIFTACLLLTLPAVEAENQKLCAKKTLKLNKKNRIKHNKALFLATGECPKNSIEVLDSSSFQGPKGADGQNGMDGADGQDGSDGEDGQLRIYGDGSASDLVVTGLETLSSGNYQFSNVLIADTGDLLINSGAVVRVTGTFLNKGIIAISNNINGGEISGLGSGSGLLVPRFRMPGAGVGHALASFGAIGDNTITLSGGNGAAGVSSSTSPHIINPGLAGGGGGAGVDGGSGGGSVVILSQGTITNDTGASIGANGSIGKVGGGGGGGGVIVLASKTEIINQGTITANGGDGGEATTTSGPGGGGGGGIVNLIAPAITDEGTVEANGGSGQAAVGAGFVSNSPRTGGGSGGSSAGDAGHGGTVFSNGSAQSSSQGASGDYNQILADPTALF